MPRVTVWVIAAVVLALGMVLSATRGAWAEPTATFVDVPPNHWAYQAIETLYWNGMTTGCSQSPHRYCPDAPITRGQVARFLVRTVRGGSYTPPPATGQVFADVPAG